MRTISSPLIVPITLVAMVLVVIGPSSLSAADGAADGATESRPVIVRHAHHALRVDAPAVVAIGQPFTMEASVWLTSRDLPDYGPDGQIRSVISALDEWRLAGRFDAAGPVTPREVPDRPPLTSQSTSMGDRFTVRQEFVCEQAGLFDIDYRAEMYTEQKVVTYDSDGDVAEEATFGLDSPGSVTAGTSSDIPSVLSATTKGICAPDLPSPSPRSASTTQTSPRPSAVPSQVGSAEVIEPTDWQLILEGAEPGTQLGQVATGADGTIAVVGTLRETGSSDPDAASGIAYVSPAGGEFVQTRLPGSKGVQMTGVGFGPDGAIYAVGTTSPFEASGHIWRLPAEGGQWEKVTRIKGARFLDMVTLDGRLLIVGQLAKIELQQDLRPMLWEVRDAGKLKPRRISNKRRIAQLAAVSPDDRIVVSGHDPTAILDEARKHGGVMWLSTDGGRKFKKIKTPIKNKHQQLVSLAVTQAGIFAGRIEFDEDGRSSGMKVFVSTDGGRTWDESLDVPFIGPIVPFDGGVAVFGPQGDVRGTRDGQGWTQIDVAGLEPFIVSRVWTAGDGTTYASGIQLGEGVATPALYQGRIPIRPDVVEDEEGDDVIAEPALNPDLDGDGAFDQADVDLLQAVSEGGSVPEGASIQDYDRNDDGVIDQDDVAALSSRLLANARLTGDYDGNGILDQQDVAVLQADVDRRREAAAKGESTPAPDPDPYDHDLSGSVDDWDVNYLSSYIEAFVDPVTGQRIGDNPDVNRDLLVDSEDVALISTELSVRPGPRPPGDPFDVDRDGDLDADDLAIVELVDAQLNPRPEDYDYDLNDDGSVDKADVVMIKAELEQRGAGPARFPDPFNVNLDFLFDERDVGSLLAAAFAQLLHDPDYRPDVNGDGSFDQADVAAVMAELGREGAGPRSAGDAYDIDQDCDLDEEDIIFLRTLVESRRD